MFFKIDTMQLLEQGNVSVDPQIIYLPKKVNISSDKNVYKIPKLDIVNIL